MPQSSPPAQPPASLALPAERLHFARSDAAMAATVEVAVEAPVGIVYGNQPYAVMMATPSDIEDFATGFSLTEGIVRAASEIRSVSVTSEGGGLTVMVDLAPGRFREHLARRRNLAGRTPCGLCGVETLVELPMAAAGPARAAPVAPRAIARALDELEGFQPLHRLTRAVHAAAWCDATGAVLAVREDVGRHNALDKLIGARLRDGHAADPGFVLVTSRASFEMVEKTAIFGAGTLVAISAPTSLAVERAQALGLTLVCVARPDAATVFAGRLAEPVGGEAR